MNIRIIIEPGAGAAGGAITMARGNHAVIFVSPDLTEAERAAAVAHELVHLRRGQAPPWWADREEVEVERDVARRLVDIAALGRLEAEAEFDPVTHQEAAVALGLPERLLHWLAA